MNNEASIDDLLQAVASMAGQQFVNAAMAEAGRIAALKKLAERDAADEETASIGERTVNLLRGQ